MNIRSILSNECRYTVNIIWKDSVSIYLINLYIFCWVSVLCEESFTICFTYCLGDIFKIAIISFWQVRHHKPLFSLYIYICSLWIITRRNHWYRRSFKETNMAHKKMTNTDNRLKKNYIPRISHNKFFVLGHCNCSWFL